MARTRSVPPSLLKRLRTLSLNAQGLHLRLPVACDDAGRTRYDLKLIADILFPGQPGVLDQLPAWLDELAREGFVERYAVAGNYLLRVIDWDLYQRVDHPRPSKLPSSPTEPAESRILDTSKALQGRDRNGQQFQPVVADGSVSRESPVFFDDRIRDSKATRVDVDRTLNALERIQKNAEDDNAYHAAIRAVLEQARLRGLTLGATVAAAPPSMQAVVTDASDDGFGKAADVATMPSPAAANGLPETNG